MCLKCMMGLILVQGLTLARNALKSMGSKNGSRSPGHSSFI